MLNPVKITIEDNGQHGRELSSCPNLGVIEDRYAWFNYPNPANLCFHAKPAQAVMLDYQVMYCLSPNHKQCLVFAKAADEPLPASIRFVEIFPKKPARPKWMVFAAAGLVLLVAFMILSLTRGNGGASTPTSEALAVFTQTPVDVALELMPATATQTATLPTATPLPPTITPTARPSNTPTITPSPTSSPTPAPTQFAAMGEPFGPDGKYMLYQLGEGESLENIAAAYKTKAAVIWAANELIVGASVRPGTVLLLFPGIKDPTTVVKYKVVQVMAPTLAKHIAAEYGVSVELLVEYNQINPEIPLPGGRWLIFPTAP